MNSLIIWPMFSLVMLTCLVLLSLPFMRMMAMQTRKAHIKDFGMVILIMFLSVSG